MPRLPRIFLEGAVYYVTSQAANEQVIFKEKADYLMYLDLLVKSKKENKFKLFGFNLQPKELHLLIEPSEDSPISNVMHDINSTYTKQFNSRSGRRGPLFESRFRSVFVEKENYLLPVTRYLHDLPCSDESYSSFHLYKSLANIQSDAATTGLDLSGEIREVIGFLQKKEGNSDYEKYCGEKGENKDIQKRLGRGSFLGSEAFVASAKRKMDEQVETLKKNASPRIASKPMLAALFVIAVLAFGSAAYLYITKGHLQDRYQSLLMQREMEFMEQSRFENRSPIALTGLDGTRWEVETLVWKRDEVREIGADVLRFDNGQVASQYFQKMGFGPALYTVADRAGRAKLWEAVQTKPNGDKVAWRGDWQGDVMRGTASWQVKGKQQAFFSFYSLKWDYEAISENAGEKEPQ